MFTHSPRHPRPRARQGFTLIEMMAVIVIISILMALLLPAINRVRITARNGQVRTEISALESAIATFKSQFGMEPPSLITVYETSTGWANDTTGSRAYIRQMWPQFDFTYSWNTGNVNNADLNNDGVISTTGITLSLCECLVFFVGGMPTPSTINGKVVYSMSGFSKNPANPWAQTFTNSQNNVCVPVGTGRNPSIWEFDSSRLIDINGNGFPEFMDPLPSQNLPYLYYSAYDGAGYAPAEFGGGGLSEPYRQTTSSTSPQWKQKNCQIISPGYDRSYGFGGAFIPTGTDRLPYDLTQYPNPFTMASGAVPTGAARNLELDNITNFFGGTLGGN